MDYSDDISIDLHIHSTASDGTLSPPEILAMAQRLRLGAIAITDHDVLSGSKEVLATDIPTTIKFLTGIEISTAPPPSFDVLGSFHLLGYGIRIGNQKLNKTLLKLRNARRDRNPRILERLKQLGVYLSASTISATPKGGLKGRPHIAVQMVNKGYVKTINEAFDRYLGTGKPAYVNKYRVDCIDAIELIVNAGGIPVLAHPFLYDTGDTKRMDRLIKTLTEMGLRGIEAYYPDHTEKQTAWYVTLAEKYDLLLTGGTDFHGSLKPDIKMGNGYDDFFVPYQLYEKLAASL